MIDLLTNLPAILAALGALLVGVWGYGKRERRKGRREGAERVSRRAEAAAEKRKDVRDEIDANNDVSVARDRLRDDWPDK